MTAPIKSNPHHPPHWFEDNTWYALTACTFSRATLFNTDAKKTLFRDQLRDLVADLHWSLAAWVLLDNHYHLLIKPERALMIPHFIKQLHGSTSHAINKIDEVSGRRVWQNYWDTCMRNERGYWMRFNYIHHNSVKHGYAPSMLEYQFSSYGYYLQKWGEDTVADTFSSYPITDYTDQFDDGK